MRDTRPIPVEIQVGGGLFCIGIELQTVLDAIERQFLYPSEIRTVRPETPEQLKSRLAKIAGFVAACQSGSLPPDIFKEFAAAQEALRESVDWACTELTRLRANEARFVSVLTEARDYILNKAARHDLNWRDGHTIIEKIDAVAVLGEHGSGHG